MCIVISLKEKDNLRCKGTKGQIFQKAISATFLMQTGLSFSDWAAGDLLASKEQNTTCRRAEASFDLYGDDNGPGSEPPPQDRIRYALTVTPSRRWPPSGVVVGKPSFACLTR